MSSKYPFEMSQKFRKDNSNFLFDRGKIQKKKTKRQGHLFPLHSSSEPRKYTNFIGKMSQ